MNEAKIIKVETNRFRKAGIDVFYDELIIHCPHCLNQQQVSKINFFLYICPKCGKVSYGSYKGE